MIRALLRNAGIQPRLWLPSLRGWWRYVSDRERFRKAVENSDFAWGRELPILTEWNDSSGSLGAYFFQDQLVARWIHEDAPGRHIDIGSRLDGFIGSLSVFRKVEVLDIRPQKERVPNVVFHQVDLMRELPASWHACTPSLSCLHTIEHFGLGRYGDEIDSEGHIKGLEQMKMMVAPGGLMYLSTPIGIQRIEFNAHRIFDPATLLSWFEEGWEIVKCALMDDHNQLQELESAEDLLHFQGNVGLGIVCARRV